MTTRDQQFAQRAHDCVAALAESDIRNEFGRFCRRLPILVLQTGLCQALSFIEAQGLTHAKQPDGAGPASPGGKLRARAFQGVKQAIEKVTGEPQIFTKVLTADLASYMRLTQDALRAAHFIKRYSEAFGLGKGETK